MTMHIHERDPYWDTLGETTEETRRREGQEQREATLWVFFCVVFIITLILI